MIASWIIICLLVLFVLPNVSTTLLYLTCSHPNHSRPGSSGRPFLPTCSDRKLISCKLMLRHLLYHTTPCHTTLYHILSPMLFLTQSLNILDQHQQADKLSLSLGASTSQTSSFLPTINGICQLCTASQFSVSGLITTLLYLPISSGKDSLPWSSLQQH